MKKELIYLSIPYTFNGELSFSIVNKIAAMLIDNGLIIYSPISHSHPISEYIIERRYDAELWLNLQLFTLERCDKLLLIKIEGYTSKSGIQLLEESFGCQAEITKAKELNIPIEYITYLCN